MFHLIKDAIKVIKISVASGSGAFYPEERML